MNFHLRKIPADILRNKRKKRSFIITISVSRMVVTRYTKRYTSQDPSLPAVRYPRFPLQVRSFSFSQRSSTRIIVAIIRNLVA